MKISNREGLRPNQNRKVRRRKLGGGAAMCAANILR
jgi:hypothetical protein